MSTSVEDLIGDVRLLALIAARKDTAYSTYLNDLHFNFGGGLFKAESDLLNLVLHTEPIEGSIWVVDVNKSPIQITDPLAFTKELTRTRNEASRRYWHTCQEINHLRAKERLVNV